ncbi:MAG: FtsX-like permease family protein [Burkholderiaceae bacterium]
MRLAIGALEREVLMQFLIEAVVLAALGGLVGILLATGASVGLSALMDVPYVFNPGVNLLSFIFSAGMGWCSVVSGAPEQPPQPHRRVAPRVNLPPAPPAASPPGAMRRPGKEAGSTASSADASRAGD